MCGSYTGYLTARMRSRGLSWVMAARLTLKRSLGKEKTHFMVSRSLMRLNSECRAHSRLSTS